MIQAIRNAGKRILGLGLIVLATGCAGPVVKSTPGERTGSPAHTAGQVERPAQTPTQQRPAAEKNLRVAMLLPMSGRYAGLGQSLLESAQLALYEAGSNEIALITLDTGGDPMAAQKKAYHAVMDGAQLLIGPVFSPELEAVRPVATQKNVPILALSNNSLLSGPNTFILGYTPGEQVERVLSYARKKGVQRVAALVPRSPYGDAIMDSLMPSVISNSMTLVHSARFDKGDNTMPIAQQFASAIDARGGVDALILPVPPQVFRSFIPQLIASGMDVTRLKVLGTSRWESLDLQRMPVLGDVWFANLDPTQRRAFEKRYEEAYGHDPVSIASLAYDATALAVALTRGQNPQRHPGSAMASRLTNPKGYAGVDGIFRLKADGMVERGLAVYEVTNRGQRIIDPAPRTFTRGSR